MLSQSENIGNLFDGELYKRLVYYFYKYWWAWWTLFPHIFIFWYRFTTTKYQMFKNIRKICTVNKVNVFWAEKTREWREKKNICFFNYFIGYIQLDYLKLVSTIFVNFLFFHQMIAPQKLWKMRFISSKKLLSFLRYSNFCIYVFSCFSAFWPLL